jgi:hypothetical protein
MSRNLFKRVPIVSVKKTFQLENENFPNLETLQTSQEQSQTINLWLSAIKNDNKNLYKFKNGNSFLGEYDDKGRPIHGKIFFKNGDVYVGSIQRKWKKYEYPEEIDEDTDLDSLETYTQNYGVIHFADGTYFEGSFCFGKDW